MTSVDLADALIQGDRRALARAITIVESTRADHREQAAELLDAVLPHSGSAVRLGVSGPPGAGKSTFIQTYGLHLVDEMGHRVAVLAVDPTSAQTGGSILGDKTRMPELAARDTAFIRPSPTSGSLGGIARRTREALLLCDAAGFDQVIVETVGVGQSEIAVADIVDTMALLLPPGAGDDLQGIKRGVMELADIVVATKADGALLGPARATAADARQGLSLLRRRHPGWDPVVVLTSAIQGEGIADVAQAVARHHTHLVNHDLLYLVRRQQDIDWMMAEVTAGLLASFLTEPRTAEALDAAVSDVRNKIRSPTAAAQQLLSRHVN